MEIITLSDYLKNRFGQKVYKIALSSGCTCPNRDGTIGTGGCTFCSEGGSGEFAACLTGSDPIDQTIEKAKRRVSQKFPKGLPAEKRKFIAYFQSYTNTYGDTDRLYSLYSRVLNRSDIVGLSVGTRPDCIDDEKLQMLKNLNEMKPVWVELGLQTIHDRTAERIHRGYPTSVFDSCYHRLKDAGLEVIVHVILGLPGESREDMMETVRYLAELDPVLDGIKLQMLNILKGSRLAEEYEKHPFRQMDMEEYCSLVVDCLKLLPKETVIHRMTGDGPRKLLISPKWVTDKKRVMNLLRQKIKESTMKTYRFYGSDNPALASVHPLHNDCKNIHNPCELYDALLSVWCADTCAPRLRDRWSSDNPTLGQCSITAFLVQDIFGGKVYGILRPGGNYHCYNEVNGIVFDLTSEQFGSEKLDYTSNPEQFREVHFQKAEKKERYTLLKTALRNQLSPSK